MDKDEYFRRLDGALRARAGANGLEPAVGAPVTGRWSAGERVVTVLELQTGRVLVYRSDGVIAESAIGEATVAPTAAAIGDFLLAVTR